MENYTIEHKLEKMNVFTDIRDYKSVITFLTKGRPFTKFVTDFYVLYHYFSILFDENEKEQVFEFHNYEGTTVISKNEEFITFEVSQFIGEVSGELYFSVIYGEEFKRFVNEIKVYYDEKMDELAGMKQ
jgi:hypothetical protein